MSERLSFSFCATADPYTLSFPQCVWPSGRTQQASVDPKCHRQRLLLGRKDGILPWCPERIGYVLVILEGSVE